MDPILHEKLIGLWETAMGSALATLPFWVKALDGVALGAHYIASFGGAGLAIHGIYRIIKKRRRRFDGTLDRRDS